MRFLGPMTDGQCMDAEHDRPAKMPAEPGFYQHSCPGCENTHILVVRDPLPNSEAIYLARALLELADVAGMPDSYRATDTRVRQALDLLDAQGVERPLGWEGV